MKMRNAVFRVADARRQVAHGNTRPKRVNDDFDVAAHACAGELRENGCHFPQRVNAEAAHCVADRAGTCFERDPKVRDFAPLRAGTRRVGIVDGNAIDEAFGKRARFGEKFRNIRRFVLPVGVDLERVCETVFPCAKQPAFYRGSLSEVFFVAKIKEIVFPAKKFELVGVVASVVDDEHGNSAFAQVHSEIPKLREVIVNRNEQNRLKHDKLLSESRTNKDFLRNGMRSARRLWRGEVRLPLFLRDG